jgi:hypothetical protein
MQKLLTVLAASALLATSAIAAPIAAADTAQRATAQQMDETQGTYRLSDGRRADIFMLENRLYVRIGRSQQKELVLAGWNRFASRDGSIAIQFGPMIDKERIVLEHAPSIGQLDTIRIASNERPGRGSAD